MDMLGWMTGAIYKVKQVIEQPVLDVYIRIKKGAW